MADWPVALRLTGCNNLCSTEEADITSITVKSRLVFCSDKRRVRCILIEDAPDGITA